MKLTRQDKINKQVQDHLCTTYMVEDHLMQANGADINLTLSPTVIAKVWVFDRNGTSGPTLPRMKVCNTPGKFSKKNNFVITIDPIAPVVVVGQSAYGADEMQALRKWITTNYDQLVRYWNEEYTADPRPFFNALQYL